MPGMLDNLTSSAKGMLFNGAGEKAILYVLNPASDLDKLSDIAKAANGLQKDLINGPAKGEGILAKAKNLVSLSDNGTGIRDTLTGGGRSSSFVGTEDKAHPQFIKIKVQYNPATIRLSTVNGKIQTRKAESGIDRLNIYKFSGKSKLSFDLVFDDMDINDSFMLENLTPNVGNVSTKLMNTLTHSGKSVNDLNEDRTGMGSGYSVRKRMDAILSLLSTAGSQQVVFFWSSMCFRGTLTNVQNRFTMFNTAGNPVRGTMHIELTQDKKTTELDFDESYWDKAFNKKFKDASAKTSAKEIAGKVGDAVFNNNFINLGI